MGRPRSPLVDRREAITKALDIIDRDGLPALNLRRLGTELGVSGAALYHHFTDKDEILRGVVGAVMSKTIVPLNAEGEWDEILIASATNFRQVLVSHPNAAPLFVPGSLPARNGGNAAREHMASLMLASGVPEQLCYPIIESAEMLAYGSAMMNPNRLPPAARLGLSPASATSPENLPRVIAATPTSTDELFDLELAALVRGWQSLIAQARTSEEKHLEDMH
ncbi:TetR/AcrR family transcriptional regulator [Frankia sp. R82]|uniref:TetR/AcrR family transcriptional regulator n=1 Tax=Frankia sp. R82 TaxID=2950553 RepID=UPI002043696D|nr:TetR/AcrR family transcriptional regulator [Frankia sp. R82]MCM3883180.1 TetR/AcrR family transcriptional regulator [Frankia sp. R82]